MDYIRRMWRRMLPCGIVFAVFNLYFFFFIQNGTLGYLLYVDTLFLVLAGLWLAGDYWRFRGEKKEKERLMGEGELICRVFSGFENQDIAEHDVRVMEEQADLRFRENCDLQDYVAKWCHELKIPLAAAFLMDEKIGDQELKAAIREQLERMNQQIHSMLLGCRLQSPLMDLQVKRVRIAECVRQSVGNYRFFLIQNGFEIMVEVGEIEVYTDPAWLVYILDQLMNNAIKYKKGRGGDRSRTEIKSEVETEPYEDASEKWETDWKETDRKERTVPRIHIWAVQQKEEVQLFVEDNGEGIKDCDIRRIFEKGYTGSNYHNGQYKSTGMGLYMVAKIVDRLGHKIQVESEYGVYTRFAILFKENLYFFRHG